MLLGIYQAMRRGEIATALATQNDRTGDLRTVQHFVRSEAARVPGVRQIGSYLDQQLGDSEQVSIQEEAHRHNGP